jgi:putative membrane protein
MQQQQRLSPLIAAILATALFGVAPAQAGSGQAATPSATQGAAATGTAPAAAPATAAKLSRADRNALTDLAMANMAEIATAKIALAKSQNVAVKTFAQRMIDDHTKAQAEVAALAQAKGVELPTELSVKHKAKSALLEGLEGEIFNRTYIKQSGRTDHRDTHDKMRDGLGKLKDPDVKALIAKIRPVVEQHLLMADELIAQSGRSTMGTAGAPTK